MASLDLGASSGQILDPSSLTDPISHIGGRKEGYATSNQSEKPKRKPKDKKFDVWKKRRIKYNK